MKILVCVKQVPDTTEVKIDPVKGTLIREGVPSILNPDDANALEAALQLKDKDPEGTSVAVLTMGPPQATYMLRECLAMGADEAYLLSDRVFGGRRYLRNLHHHRSRHPQGKRAEQGRYHLRRPSGNRW